VFAHYGHRRDVLDLALHYDHCNLSTPFAHSAPMEIAVEGIGRIRIEHQDQRAPVHPFDPPRVTWNLTDSASAISAVIRLTLSACKRCSALLCRLSSKEAVMMLPRLFA
tara:strand:+ start:459 stop:785 length:327 start_codon:yes stop_codon:yes gene_type:complete